MSSAGLIADMPLSRTHPFTVPSSGLSSHTSYIQETTGNLPPLKSVLKEQAASATALLVAAATGGGQGGQSSSQLSEGASSSTTQCNLSHAHIHGCTHSRQTSTSGKSTMAPSGTGGGATSATSSISTATTTTSSQSQNSPQPSTDKPNTMIATPEQVMKHHSNKLTPYEHTEIYAYPRVYFIGAKAKKRPGIIGAPNNCDYDNEQGSYIHIPHDHVAYRYEVLKVIGKGSFGQVVKAYDHKTHEQVALKMVRNEKRFHRQAQEEVLILDHLRKKDKDNTMNIIHMYDHFTFRSHMCITFELLSINLYELIKKNKFHGFSLQLVRKFSHSLLQCLDALYKNKIIHCDMKPENVLLKQQGRSGLKVSIKILV